MERSENGAKKLSRMNLSGYVGFVNMGKFVECLYCMLFTYSSGVRVRLGLELGLVLVPGWLVLISLCTRINTTCGSRQ